MEYKLRSLREVERCGPGEIGAESPIPADEERAGTGPIASVPCLGGLHHLHL